MDSPANLFKNPEKLLLTLDEYRASIKEVEAILTFQGKTLQQIDREQVAWPFYYEQKRIELETLLKFAKMQEDKIRSTLARKYKENYSFDLGDRLRDSYIDSEPSYLAIHELVIEIEHVVNLYRSVCDCFQTRGYTLRNMTEHFVNNIQDRVI
jgi:hypothetical protein